MYLGLFKDRDNVFKDFAVEEDKREGVNIIFAVYTYADYEGSAYVLFQKNGKLYEVGGSHCSCHGLEDQWEPNETTEETLLHRVNHGSYSYDREEDKIIKEKITKALIDYVVEKEILTN